MNDDAGNGDKLLGAYWESHSDDVTAVKFHPDKFNFLATGSTDGLLNSFNLLEANEDDALLYSFNTESSVVSHMDCMYGLHTKFLSDTVNTFCRKVFIGIPIQLVPFLHHAFHV